MCEDDDPEQIVQPVLDEVPGFVWRQMPSCNRLLKEAEWCSAWNWFTEKDDVDPRAIIATSQDGDSSGPRVNILSSLAQFRCVGAHDDHQALARRVVKRFYEEGLINMRVGKKGSTALLVAAQNGNIEMAALLLEYGAGIPLWLITLWALYPELFPRGRAPIFFRLGLRRGGCGV